jgi:hypothetical protein
VDREEGKGKMELRGGERREEGRGGREGEKRSQEEEEFKKYILSGTKFRP